MLKCYFRFLIKSRQLMFTFIATLTFFFFLAARGISEGSAVTLFGIARFMRVLVFLTWLSIARVPLPLQMLEKARTVFVRVPLSLYRKIAQSLPVAYFFSIFFCWSRRIMYGNKTFWAARTNSRGHMWFVQAMKWLLILCKYYCADATLRVAQICNIFFCKR